MAFLKFCFVCTQEKMGVKPEPRDFLSSLVIFHSSLVGVDSNLVREGMHLFGISFKTISFNKVTSLVLIHFRVF